MKASRQTIGAFEAKNSFSELLEKVRQGAEITITKHDRAIARLVPVAPEEGDLIDAAEGIRAMRKRYSLKGLSIKKLIEEGRR